MNCLIRKMIMLSSIHAVIGLTTIYERRPMPSYSKNENRAESFQELLKKCPCRNYGNLKDFNSNSTEKVIVIKTMSETYNLIHKRIELSEYSRMVYLEKGRGQGGSPTTKYFRILQCEWSDPKKPGFSIRYIQDEFKEDWNRTFITTEKLADIKSKYHPEKNLNYYVSGKNMDEWYVSWNDYVRREPYHSNYKIATKKRLESTPVLGIKSIYWNRCGERNEISFDRKKFSEDSANKNKFEFGAKVMNHEKRTGWGRNKYKKGDVGIVLGRAKGKWYKRHRSVVVWLNTKNGNSVVCNRVTSRLSSKLTALTDNISQTMEDKKFKEEDRQRVDQMMVALDECNAPPSGSSAVEELAEAAVSETEETKSSEPANIEETSIDIGLVPNTSGSARMARRLAFMLK